MSKYPIEEEEGGEEEERLTFLLSLNADKEKENKTKR